MTAGELDFRSFVDHAIAEADARLDVDADAMRIVLTLHRVTSLVVYDIESSVHRPRGWSWAGFRLMFALWVAGPMEAKRCAELAGMSRAAVSSLVNTLERDGLVRRDRDPRDGRVVRLSLTEAGQAALDEGFTAHNERERRWADALTLPERRLLVRLLTKLMGSDPGERAVVRHRA